jgi:RNA polymerase sigma-70 factor (ECF subfamily)
MSMLTKTTRPQELLGATLPGSALSGVGVDAGVERDRALAAAIVGGSLEDARAFYDEHVRRVFALVHRFTGSADLAQDLTQDVFIRALERMHQYRGAVPLGAWVRSIALSVTFNALKVRKRRWLRDVGADESLPERDGEAPDVLLASRIASALDALPERSRAVVMLHDAEGYTHEEIAVMLGMAAGTSRAVLSQARATLRSVLQPVRNGRLTE